MLTRQPGGGGGKFAQKGVRRVQRKAGKNGGNALG